MKSSVFILSLGAVLLLSACQHGGGEYASNTVLRYPAWLEGNVETEYRVNRKEARRRLERYRGKPPKMEDRDRFLDYVAILDAVGRTSEAEKWLKSFLFKNPGEPRATFLLAVHYLRVNKKTLAKYFFAKLEGDSKFPWRSLLFNNLGMISLKEGDRVQAIEYFDKATKAKPPIAAPYVNLGSLYLQSRSFSDAEKLFAMAADLDENFVDAVLGRGVALEGLGQFEKAHQVYEAYLKKRPNALSLLYNDAIILGNRLNNKTLARKQLMRYIKLGGRETAKAQNFIQNWR